MKVPVFSPLSPATAPASPRRPSSSQTCSLELELSQLPLCSVSSSAVTWAAGSACACARCAASRCSLHFSRSFAASPVWSSAPPAPSPTAGPCSVALLGSWRMPPASSGRGRYWCCVWRALSLCRVNLGGRWVSSPSCAKRLGLSCRWRLFPLSSVRLPQGATVLLNYLQLVRGRVTQLAEDLG